MNTWIRRTHSVENQKRAIFTGEGAYHGSTKSTKAVAKSSAPKLPPVVISETRPTTLEKYLEEGRTEIELFEATFPNQSTVSAQLRIPTQEEVRDDGVEFVWCPFEQALKEAGPVTREVLLAIEPFITGTKRFTYIDSKIQHFNVGDLPVDSNLIHPDGTIAVKDPDQVRSFGVSILHDMKARCENGDLPLYHAYQSSSICVTGFLNRPLTVRIPTMIPNFNAFDATVREMNPTVVDHPAGAILSYDGLSLHEAREATASGWRLWLRCTETDREIIPSDAIIECYGTVFSKREQNRRSENEASSMVSEVGRD